MSKVFVSHSVKDRDFVGKEIVSFLTSQGVDTWFAEDEIQTADRWERAILKGLMDCDWFLVVMSPRSAASEWVKDEVHWAMEERPGKIIPVLLQDCDCREFHIRMARIQHVDFRDNLKEGRRRLLVALGVTPVSQPAPPLPEVKKQQPEAASELAVQPKRTFQVICPNCHQMLRLPIALAGKSVQCSLCARTFRTPENQTRPAPGKQAAGDGSQGKDSWVTRAWQWLGG